MRIKTPRNIGTVTVTAALLACFAGFACAEETAPMTPELAAKKEMVRKQQDQRVTPQKRKAAAEALKAERIKVYKAKEATGQLAPVTPETTK